MKLTNLKRTWKVLLTSFLTGAMIYATPVTAETDSETDAKKPVIVMIDNISPEVISEDYVLHNTVKKDVSLVFNLKPVDLEDSKKIANLRGLFEHNPKSSSFAIETVVSKNRLEDRALELSEQQKSFTEGFNNKSSNNYNLTSKTLSMKSPDELTIKSMMQAGFRTLISENKIENGYVLYENGVMEIYRDPQGKIIKDNSQIKTVDELIKDVKANLDPKDPFVITIDIEALLKKHGEKKTVSYLRELGDKLKDLQEKNGIEFQTFHEFYLKHPQTFQYVMLRLDDYQAFWRRKFFQKVIDDIASQNIPQTISIIPKDVNDSFHAMKYLKTIAKNPQIELAIHGYHHQDTEMNKSLEEQIKTLEKSLKELKHAKVTFHSVVPPLNELNEDTSKAMLTVDKNLKIVCSVITADNYLFGLDKDRIYHVSRTVDIVRKWEEPYSLKSYEEITSEIGNDDAVLLIHPTVHETKKYREYLTGLIKGLKNNPKIKFVTLHDFYKIVMPK